MQHPQRFWTKRHNLLNNPHDEHFYRNQIAGGIFFIKKNKTTMEFCNDWLALSSYKGGETLMDPDPNEVQIQGFKAHRHDQSTFSQTVFLHNAHHIKDETYFPNWSNALNQPILALRNRTGSERYPKLMTISQKISNFIKSQKKEIRKIMSIQEEIKHNK